MNKFTRAAVSPRGHGTPVRAFGRHIIRMSSANTGGTLGMVEAILAPGEGPPLHRHEREDEFFRVLSGSFGFWCGDDYCELQAGGCIMLPRGVPHRFENIGSDEGRLMAVVTPGGFESFFAVVDLCKPQTPDQIASIATDFGLTFLPDDTWRTVANA